MTGSKAEKPDGRGGARREPPRPARDALHIRRDHLSDFEEALEWAENLKLFRRLATGKLPVTGQTLPGDLVAPYAEWVAVTQGRCEFVLEEPVARPTARGIDKVKHGRGARGEFVMVKTPVSLDPAGVQSRRLGSAWPTWESKQRIPRYLALPPTHRAWLDDSEMLSLIFTLFCERDPDETHIRVRRNRWRRRVRTTGGPSGT